MVLPEPRFTLPTPPWHSGLTSSGCWRRSRTAPPQPVRMYFSPRFGWHWSRRTRRRNDAWTVSRPLRSCTLRTAARAGLTLRLTGLELAVPVRPDEADRFEALRRDARAALSKLDKVVREALYYDFRGELFKPDQDQWRSAEQAVEEGTLKLDEDEGGFRPDKRDRSVKSAAEALKRLDGFVNDDASPELIADYETEHSIVVDLKHRPFWRKLGL